MASNEEKEKKNNDKKKFELSEPPREQGFHFRAEIFPLILKTFLASGSTYLVLKKLILPKVFGGRKFDPKEEIYLASKLLSSIHASYISTETFRVVCLKQVWRKDTYNPYPKSLDRILSIHLGYTLFEIALFFISKEPLSLWIHHLLAALGSLLMMCYREAAFFPIIFGITEASVVPQNAIYYYQILKCNKPRLFGLLLLWRVIFYFLFRTFLGPISLLYGFSNGRYPLSTLKRTSPIVFLGSAFNIFALSYLNIIWTKMIVNSYVRYLQGKCVNG